jgi:hypothetical protein
MLEIYRPNISDEKQTAASASALRQVMGWCIFMIFRCGAEHEEGQFSPFYMLRTH